MRALAGILLVMLTAAVFATGSPAQELESRFYKDIATYYRSDAEVMEAILALELPAQDVPVCFDLSDDLGLAPLQLAKLRKQGDSWPAIMNNRGVDAKTVFMVINVDFQSRVYSPLFAKFDIPRDQWSSIELTDEDVVNMVNLKFIYRRHGFSPFEVMAARDKGKGFPTINQQIYTKRKALDDEEMKNKKAAAKKAKESTD